MPYPPDSPGAPRRKRGLPPVVGKILRDADNQNRRTSQSKGYQEVQATADTAAAYAVGSGSGSSTGDPITIPFDEGGVYSLRLDLAMTMNWPGGGPNTVGVDYGWADLLVVTAEINLQDVGYAVANGIVTVCPLVIPDGGGSFAATPYCYFDDGAVSGFADWQWIRLGDAA